MLPLQTAVEGNFPFQKIHINLLGKLPLSSKNANTYILGVIDAFSKYVIAIAIPDKQCKTVAEALTEHVFLKFSVPNLIVSDCGQEFVAEIMRTFEHQKA